MNVVRSYSIDYANYHDDCTKEFAKDGIYAFIDLAAPGLTIGNTNPVWNDALYDRYTKAIDAMLNYANNPGFNVGDSVAGRGVNDLGPYIETAVRFMKAYIRRKEYCLLPVRKLADAVRGSIVGIDDVSQGACEYRNCGVSNDEINFIGVNNGHLLWTKTKPTPAMRLLHESFRIRFHVRNRIWSGCSLAQNRDLSQTLRC